MCLGVHLLMFTQLGFTKLLRFVNKYFSSNFRSFQPLFFQKMFIVPFSYSCRTLNPHKLIHLLLYYMSTGLCHFYSIFYLCCQYWIIYITLSWRLLNLSSAILNFLLQRGENFKLLLTSDNNSDQNFYLALLKK